MTENLFLHLKSGISVVPHLIVYRITLLSVTIYPVAFFLLLWEFVEDELCLFELPWLCRYHELVTLILLALARGRRKALEGSVRVCGEDLKC